MMVSIRHLVGKRGEFEVKSYNFMKTKTEILFHVRGIHVVS